MFEDLEGRIDKLVDRLLRGKRHKARAADAAERDAIMAAAELAAAREGYPRMSPTFRRRLASTLRAGDAPGLVSRRTALGAVVAIPLSFVAAGNLMRRNPIGSAVYFLVRTLMSMIRAIPTIFWGILFVTSVGLGPFPGVLAVMIFSVGLMSKLFSEAIEAIDWGQVEALTATGANPIQVLVNGVGPQVLPYLVAHLLYSFEVNVHSATILGLIGAGGIGFLFSQYIEQFLYRQEAMVLIVVVLMTMAIDYTSATIRRRII